MAHSNDTHLKTVGYILWIFGFTGSHRFYYGKPVSGTIWFFTLGLFLIGWIIDLFLIPGRTPVWACGTFFTFSYFVLAKMV